MYQNEPIGFTNGKNEDDSSNIAMSKVLESSFFFPLLIISLVSSILGTGLKMRKVSKSFPLKNTS